MKVFYTTDLHGQKKKYKMVIRELKDHDVVILGADILPKGGATIDERKDFIFKFLPDFFSQIQIPVIIDFGNDDLVMLYDDFLSVVSSCGHVHVSHMNEVVIGDYSILGMHFVPDYPFGLKDWCRREEEFPIDPLQIQLPATTEGGYRIIPDLKEYLDSRPSIDDFLSWLPKPSKDRVIYNFHSPPRHVGFDICRGGSEKVGSYAVTNFIMEKKPLLTLHGHIHESPFYSGLTINRLIPETVSIQPGQSGSHNMLVCCEFELEDIEKTYVRKEIEWKKSKHSQHCMPSTEQRE